MPSRPYCDGFIRRDMLRIGAAGLFGSGLSLPQMLAAESYAKKPRDTGVSFIYVFLKGGLSTIDTWDLKPNAPPEFRGELAPSPPMFPAYSWANCCPNRPA